MNSYFLNYDITFCSHKECRHFECMRHNNNVPIGVPVSMFLIDNPDDYDTENCKMYYKEYGEYKEITDEN